MNVLNPIMVRGLLLCALLWGAGCTDSPVSSDDLQNPGPLDALGDSLQGPGDVSSPQLDTDVTEPSDTDVTEPSDTDVTEPSDTDVAEPGDADVTESSDADVTEPSDADVAEPSDADVAEPSDADVAEPSDADGGVGLDTSDGDGGIGPSANACLEPGEGPSFKIAARADLRWKRVHGLEADLLKWMQLTPQEVCGELGIDGICFSLAHLVPLGGNDPIYAAMYTPIPRPGITSVLSMERVTLAACGKRVDMDAFAMKSGMDASVFQGLDLNGGLLSPDDPEVVALIEQLYRLVLARDPTSEEVDLLKELAAPLPDSPEAGIHPRDFAKTACFVVATTSEALLH